MKEKSDVTVTRNITPFLRFVSSQTLHRHLRPIPLRSSSLSISPMPFPNVLDRPVQTSHLETRIISSAPLVEYRPLSFLQLKLVEGRLGIRDGILQSLLEHLSDLLPVSKTLLPMGSFSI